MLGKSDAVYWLPDTDWIYLCLWPWLWPIIRLVVGALIPLVIYNSMMSFSNTSQDYDHADEQQEQQDIILLGVAGPLAPSLPLPLPSILPLHDAAPRSPSSSSSEWEMPSPGGSSSVRVRAVKHGFLEMAWAMQVTQSHWHGLVLDFVTYSVTQWQWHDFN